MRFLPAGGRMGVSPPRRRAGVAPAGAGWGVSCPGTSTFLFCKKKGTKENHLDLRFKDPLARGGFRRPGGESVSPDGEAASGGHISFCEERNVGKKVA